jgi:hypothetical protein
MEGQANTTAAAAAAVVRGKAFTSVEDLLICKAFISVSEDPIKGANQGGGEFKGEVHKKYLILIAEKCCVDAAGYQNRPDQDKAAPPSVYPPRSPDSLFNRFKKIAASVMKMMSVVANTPMTSGANAEDYLQECAITYEQRYVTTHGKFGLIKECYKYLATSPKFHSYKTMTEAREAARSADQLKENERPVGNKKARQQESNKRMIQDNVVDVVAARGSGSSSSSSTQESNAKNHTMMQMSREFGMLSNSTNSAGSYMAEAAKLQREAAEREVDKAMVEFLDTPEKKEFYKLQLKLRMKAMKKELDEEEGVTSVPDSRKRKNEELDLQQEIIDQLRGL